MNNELEKLIAEARGINMNANQKEAQRRSFAYGNSKIENDRITRDSIDKQSKALAAEDAQKH